MCWSDTCTDEERALFGLAVIFDVVGMALVVAAAAAVVVAVAVMVVVFV